jgi:hypothetical protein
MSEGNSGVEGAGPKVDGPIDPAAAIGGNGSGGTVRDSAGNDFDPTVHSSPDSRNADGTFRRKRGRKSRGSSGSAKPRSQIHSDIKETAQFLAQGLLLFHTSMAAMTNTPELVLDKDEAQGLAESGLTLAAMYDIQPDPKLQAAILFAGQVGMIYGTRIVAIRARKSQEKEERRKGTAGMYDADGNPIGTTTFTTDEWPIDAESHAVRAN